MLVYDQEEFHVQDEASNHPRTATRPPPPNLYRYLALDAFGVRLTRSVADGEPGADTRDMGTNCLVMPDRDAPTAACKPTPPLERAADEGDAPGRNGTGGTAP
jgi:hypothetical protein